MLQITFVFFCLAAFVVNGQVVFPRRCPSHLKGIDNFNVTKYLGKWYEQEKYLTIFEIGGKCITADYSLNEDGTVRVVNREYISGKIRSIEGYAKLANDEGRGEIIVRFPNLPVPFNVPYWVLDTDYKSYSVVWSCVSSDSAGSARFLWILTRDQNPSEKVLDKAHSVLKKNGISRLPLMKTNQKNCS